MYSSTTISSEINLRSDPNASVRGGNPQSSSFEEAAACVKTNPERTYGKEQSRGGDAKTVLEIVFDFLSHGVSVSFEQCLFKQDAGGEIALA